MALIKRRISRLKAAARLAGDSVPRHQLPDWKCQPQQKMKAKNMTTLHLRKSINRSPLRRGFLLTVVALILASFALSPMAQAQYPPLPRRCTDAFLEWYCFMVGQITIGQPYMPRTPEKLWFAQAMAAQRLTPAQMEIMWNMPVFWATFKMGWSNLSEWQKEAARRSWRLQIAWSATYGTQQGFASGPSNVSPSYTGKSDSELRRQLENERYIGNAVNSALTSSHEAMMNIARNMKY